MSITHFVNVSWQSSASNAQLQSQIAAVGDEEVNLSIGVGHGVTNQKSDVTVKTGSGRLKSVYIKTNTDVTLCTNAASGGSPTNTLVIPANAPLLWYAGDGAQPFSNSVDVTSFYITNASGSVDAVVECRILMSSM